MKNVFFVVFLASFLITTPVFALTDGSEISITKDGKISLKKAKVFQVAGTNFYTRLYWDDVFLRVAVVTNSKTKINKRYGEVATASDFKEGDILDIEGFFPSSSDSFIMTATSIKNNSLEKEKLTTSGTILSVKNESDEFTMKTTKGNIITVVASMAKIKRGIITITPNQIVTGEKVTSADGIYDYSSDVLSADNIQIYQDKSVFLPHNFKGVIKSISGTTLPVTIVVGLTKKDYNVTLRDSTKFLNKRDEKIELSRFLVGDTVRFYGAILENDLSTVDSVEIFRNLNL